MAEFRARFIVRAAEDAARIRHALDAGDFARLREVCHGLSGNAGMFGFAELGVSAQAVEEAIDAGTPEGPLRGLAAALLDRLAALDERR